MCTLTWITDPEGCRIFFNRDEKRTRLPASPPSIKVIEGVRVLTPSDGDAGGTWLAVNEHGIAVAVLNYYEADARIPDNGKQYESRGQLVLNVSACKSLGAVRDAMSAVQADEYRPFVLTAFDEGGETAAFRWDGSSLVAEPLPDSMRPITTSSFKTADVLAVRKEQYKHFADTHGGVSDTMLRAYQHCRDEHGGAYSVTMTRADAQTVSYSEVAIRKDVVTYFYQPREMDLNDPPYLPGKSYQLKRA